MNDETTKKQQLEDDMGAWGTAWNDNDQTMDTLSDFCYRAGDQIRGLGDIPETMDEIGDYFMNMVRTPIIMYVKVLEAFNMLYELDNEYSQDILPKEWIKWFIDVDLNKLDDDNGWVDRDEFLTTLKSEQDWVRERLEETCGRHRSTTDIWSIM